MKCQLVVKARSTSKDSGFLAWYMSYESMKSTKSVEKSDFFTPYIVTGVKFLYFFFSMGRFSLTCASSVPASWLTAWRAEETDAELGLGWALQQQGLAVLHNVSTHLGTEDITSQVTDMNNHDYGYKTPYTFFPIVLPSLPFILLDYVKTTLCNFPPGIHYYCFIYRILFIIPAAWPPPSRLFCLLSLQVQRSQPALATSPARSLPGGQAGTGRDAKTEEMYYQLYSSHGEMDVYQQGDRNWK